MANTTSGSASAHIMLLFAVVCFTICSMGMMVFNKLAIRAFPLPCSLVVLQMLFTVLVVGTVCRHSIHIGSLNDVKRWSVVVPFFVGMLLTSMFALQDAPMSLVITFRALSPLLSMAAEQFFPNPQRVGPRSVFALIVMVSGASLYTKDIRSADKTSYHAIGWVALNSLLAVVERLLQRLMLSRDQAPVDISKTGLSLINNALGLVPMCLAALITKEHSRFVEVISHMSSLDVLWVSLSCLVGVGISFSAIWAQSLISATSMLVLTNSNKFVVILLELFAMPSTSVLTLCQIMGACVTVGSTVLYARARDFEQEMQRLAAAAADPPEEGQPLIEKKV